MSNNKAPSSSPASVQKSPSQPPSMMPGSTSPQVDNTNGEKKESTAHNLPPKRQSSSIRKVSPPLSSVRLSRLIYLLVGLITLMLAYYSFRVVQYKREVGGWWSLAMGKTPAQVHAQGDYTNVNSNKESKGDKENPVEDRINALAEALGMPSNDLASAIAGAVRAYVPPASLSSVAAKETGEAVKVLLNRVEEEEGSTGTKPEADTQADTGSGVVGGILHGVESFAGIDEPTI